MSVGADDLVWDSLNAWVANVTGLLAIRVWQGGPQPIRPYLTTNMVSLHPVRDWERDWLGEEDPTSGRILATPPIEMEWNFSINAYSETPTDHLRPLISASRLTQVEEPNFPSLVIHRTSPIRNLSEWHDTDWEPRAQIDLDLRGVTLDGHLVDTIETIEGITITRVYP